MAADRVHRLQGTLRHHERLLLGEIQRLNWLPNGGLANLNVATGFNDEKMRNAAILGRVQAFLCTVAEFYDALKPGGA